MELTPEIDAEENIDAEEIIENGEIIDAEEIAVEFSKETAVGWPAINPVLPAIGHIDAYIRAIHQLPYLTQEEEVSFARKLRDENDFECAAKLTMSHLRMVVSASRNYLGYGLPHADLIQEGTIGLMKAVKRFDPEMGIRLASYAGPWIRSEISDYVLKNTRMVKLATSKTQRKLFYNLRSMRNEMFDRPQSHEKHREWMNSAEIQEMSDRLNVPVSDVIEMEKRLGGSDLSTNSSFMDGEGDVNALERLHEMQELKQEPSLLLEVKQQNRMVSEGVPAALSLLNERERRIIEERWIKDISDGESRLSLHDLSAEFGVSAERIRQIEVKAMKTMRKVLEKYV